MNILIAQDATVASNWKHEGWASAVAMFGGQRLLQCIATLTLVQPDTNSGESLDEAFDETIETLISNQVDRNLQGGAPRVPTDQDRYQVTQYLKDAVAHILPYMPDTGSMELVTYLTDPNHKTMYLVVRYWPDDEHSSKAFTSPSIRG